MLAPTVELLSHSNLHPALCDLLIDTAFEVHGHASLLQSAGQFPTPSANFYPLSDEAARYYKTGNKSFASLWCDHHRGRGRPAATERARFGGSQVSGQADCPNRAEVVRQIISAQPRRLSAHLRLSRARAAARTNDARLRLERIGDPGDVEHL